MNRPRRFDAMRKDGSLVPIELCVTRADIPGGGAPLFVGMIRDMSVFAAAERSRDEERERAQQQLAEQTSALQQANLRLRMADRMASIGTLAAGLGHDMNNVLLPVRARLNALKAAGDDGRIAAGERKHVDEIRKSVAYLQQLADGLHFLALDPDTEEDARGGGASTDLKEWWSQAGPLLSKAVPRHVRVTAQFPGDLPRVAVAAHGLTQAMLNLVVNAGEAIPPPAVRKGRQGHVRISARRVDDAERSIVRLSVCDNGSGMPEEVKRRAFEMFFTTKPRGLGTGLGLALVRKVIERAGGEVGIDSEPGKGTVVEMQFPTVGLSASPIARVRPRAVVSLRDGRVAAIVRMVLESSGAIVAQEPGCADADIWVVDPFTADSARAKARRTSRPNASFVLLGKPDHPARASWAADAITVEDPNDFDAVRAAIGRALART